MEEEEKINRDIHPEKFKMARCPSCRGAGKSSDAEKGIKVCTRCGGFGWIKIEKDIREK